jgi:hypothetical protein
MLVCFEVFSFFLFDLIVDVNLADSHDIIGFLFPQLQFA